MVQATDGTESVLAAAEESAQLAAAPAAVKVGHDPALWARLDSTDWVTTRLDMGTVIDVDVAVRAVALGCALGTSFGNFSAILMLPSKEHVYAYSPAPST